MGLSFPMPGCSCRKLLRSVPNDAALRLGKLRLADRLVEFLKLCYNLLQLLDSDLSAAGLRRGKPRQRSHAAALLSLSQSRQVLLRNDHY